MTVEPILICWIGRQDLLAAERPGDEPSGPIGQAVARRDFSAVHLLCDYPREKGRAYVAWLRQYSDAKISLTSCTLSSPTNYPEIYREAVRVVDAARQEQGAGTPFVYHLSPGTPAMAAVWIILAKTSRPAELIHSSPEAGVETVEFPFDLAADYIGGRVDDTALVQMAQGLPPEAPAFDAIIYRCEEMARQVLLARRLALHDVPVLIQGESGTGKELFARAIHYASRRSEGPLVTVNCGAIPENLVESELFGHKRGAFTGASADRAGYLEVADGGTLFLDELGELPLVSQVKLLRALQEGRIRRLGDEQERSIDIRVIAATNRDLLQDIHDGRFREDLFHRVAVGMLYLPPLRDRQGDLTPLADALLAEINRQLSSSKDLSAGARNLIYQHPWPGNVRELWNTLMRAAIWSPAPDIRKEDLAQALLPVHPDRSLHDRILNRPLGQDLDLGDLLAQVARHYLQRAMEESGGNKTRAAELVGLASYQTLSNWLDRYGLSR